MTNPTPVAILVRVSTHKQETDRQVQELTDYCHANGLNPIEIVHEQISGNSVNREGLNRVLDLARTKQIAKVLVHEVSRIARRNSIAHKFVEDLSDMGVSLYWHAQRIETLLPDGRCNPAAALMFAMLSEMARAEREQLIERTKSGIMEARRKGKILGRPKGSTYSPQKLLSEHPAVVKHIKSGQSIRNTAKLTEVAHTTVIRVKRAMETLSA